MHTVDGDCRRSRLHFPLALADPELATTPAATTAHSAIRRNAERFKTPPPPLIRPLLGRSYALPLMRRALAADSWRDGSTHPLRGHPAVVRGPQPAARDRGRRRAPVGVCDIDPGHPRDRHRAAAEGGLRSPPGRPRAGRRRAPVGDHVSDRGSLLPLRSARPREAAGGARRPRPHPPRIGARAGRRHGLADRGQLPERGRRRPRRGDRDRPVADRGRLLDPAAAAARRPARVHRPLLHGGDPGRGAGRVGAREPQRRPRRWWARASSRSTGRTRQSWSA